MALGHTITRGAIKYRERLSMVFKDTSYTYEELNTRVNRLANALQDIGLKKGDRIAILLDWCPQYVEIILAAAKNGLVPVPLRGGIEEFSHIMANSEPRAIIFGGNHTDVLDSISAKVEGIKNLIAIVPTQKEALDYEELLSSHPFSEPTEKVSSEDLACLFYSSGTTGRPKGAMLTHENVVAQSLRTIIAWHIGPDDVLLLGFPLFVYYAVFPLFYMGGTLLLIDKFSPEALLEAIERHKVTIFYTDSSVVAQMINYSDFHNYDLSSLNSLVYANTAMIPIEVVKKAVKAFGNILLQVYGQVETGLTTCLTKEVYAFAEAEGKWAKLHSIGKPVINGEIRVVDENGIDVAPGDVGEIIVKGEIVTKSYWRLPQVAAEILHDGYTRSGDLATVDSDGYIYFKGRKKDAILHEGRYICPPDIEDVLHLHPAIAEAAVIGIPDEKLGESIKALIVLKEGKQTTEKEIIDFSSRYLPSFAIPDSIEFVDSLPKGAFGKVLKRVLREQR